ncbi:MAG TPA: glycosyltransferase family 4 protein [Steroidobacteraceae bacterium]|nr:glycosyltransferase family 4 protein [Steroidobacteraceae bacterium]
MTSNPLRPEADRHSVLLVIASLGGGGAERQLAEMANYWAAKHWQVALATWSGLDVPDFYPLEPGVRRISLAGTQGARRGSRIGANVGRIMRLRRLLISTRPQAVLSFMTESNLLTILAGTGLPVRVVVSERVQPAMHHAFPRAWRILRRALYARAQAVVAQTRDAADWLDRNCHTSATVIPNALRGLPEPPARREELIVAAGRLTRQKGFDVLLHAFGRIAPRFPRWQLAIVGEGEERRSLGELRGRLNLEKRVELVGASPDVLAWMAQAALIVQPSRFEGFPNVVLEGMGLGAAVVSTDCPSGPSEMIQDGVNGRLVPVDDAVRLAEVMAELIERPAERARLGLAATGVRERYRQDIVMDRWESCLFPGAALAHGTARCAGEPG